MNIFVCEYITAGGLYRDNLPASLLKEACLMRDALLYDLGEIEGLRIIQTYDSRTPPPECFRTESPLSASVHQVKQIMNTDDIWAIWENCMRKADAVWLVAPESDGILYQLTRIAERLGKLVIGASSAAIALTGNKFLTFQHLTKHNIATPPTCLADRLRDLPDVPCYVAKRIDGVSCEDSQLFDDKTKLAAWLMQDRQHTHIVQPYIEGDSLSLSAVYSEADPVLLSINQQKISLQNSAFKYHGSTLNVMSELLVQAEHMLKQVARAISGLRGYIGLDVILRDNRLILLEINPRLTTSYAGMHQALGVNPAAMILALIQTGKSDLYKKIERKQIEIAL